MRKLDSLQKEVEKYSPRPGFIVGPYGFAKRSCKICSGKGYTRFAEPGSKGFETFCSCVSSGYKSKLKQILRDPCPNCEVVGIPCVHRPATFEQYQMIMARFNECLEYHTTQIQKEMNQPVASKFEAYGDICNRLREVEHKLMERDWWATAVRSSMLYIAKQLDMPDLLAWIPICGPVEEDQPSQHCKLEPIWQGFVILSGEVRFVVYDEAENEVTESRVVETLEDTEFIIRSAIGELNKQCLSK